MIRIAYAFLLVFCLACTPNSNSQKEQTPTPQEESFKWLPLKWAKNFRVKEYKNYKQVELLQDNQVYQTFILSQQDQPTTSDVTRFKTPLKQIASASCVYTKMFEELGDLNRIKGIDKLQFQFSPSIVDYVESNNILEFGSGESLKTEDLFVLHPDVLFTWTSNQSNQQINKLVQLGVPVVFASSYLENHPLARAEWIKFFALFVDKLPQAEAYFNTIESNYLNIKKADNHPTEFVLVNAPYSGQWYLPTPNSYMGNLLKDANFKLQQTDSTSTGAKAFTLEHIIANNQNAKFWLNPSHYTSLNQIEETDSRFNQLKAFKENNVYNAIKRKRPNGGNDYWEQGVLRPDLILKDLQHIYNNHPSDSLYFFSKLDK